MKRLIDGEIMYFLDNNRFFPPNGGIVDIFENTPQNEPNIQAIHDALKITIPVKRHLSYQFHHIAPGDLSSFDHIWFGQVDEIHPRCHAILP